MKQKINRVLDFWFEETKPEQWFKKDPTFDNKIKLMFLDLTEAALTKKLTSWQNNKKGSLALILLLDQFTRNIFRNSKKSFSGDLSALTITLDVIERGYLPRSPLNWCHFMLIPMMHSENLNIQNQSLAFFKKYTSRKTYSWAIKHQKIILEFGRFPHRNIILGRDSTKKEIDFLKKPGSSF
jgi:uncharacterized protein (DUF924 family)